MNARTETQRRKERKGAITLQSIVLLLCMLLAAGCDPGEINPPAAVLEAEGSTQTAGIGSYCWKSLLAAQCGDRFAIPTSEQPLSFPRDGSVQLRLPIEDPSVLSMTVVPVGEAEAVPGSSQGTRLWRLPFAQSNALLLEAEQPIELELEPGLYVLYIFAAWDGVGDVGYGFLLEAR